MAAPCLLRKFNSEEQLEVVLVVHGWATDWPTAKARHSDDGAIQRRQLATKFSIKDLNEANFYMSRHIALNRARSTLAVNRHVYANTIIDRFHVEPGQLYTGIENTAAAVTRNSMSSQFFGTKGA